MRQPTHVQEVSAHLTAILIEAVRYAGEQLSLLVEREICLRGTSVERLRLEQLPALRADEDEPVTAIHLGFSGAFEGHVILSFSPRSAGQLAEALLMEPVCDDGNLSEMERSALGEVGNVTAASFLNSVADACRLTVSPSPPTVVQDMIGALLQNVVTEMALDSTHALLVHTVFEVAGDRLQGELILLPTAAACAHLEGTLAQCS